MAVTTGLEPATSGVTGRGRSGRCRGCSLDLNRLRESHGAISEACHTVRATVRKQHPMLVLAYSICGGGEAETAPQVGLAYRLA